MEAPTTADVFLFEDFRLDRGGLSRREQNGAFVSVPIGSRALEILAVLVARPGELVTRDEIIATVWPGTIVESSNLPVQIASLRRALDHGRTNGSLIQTVPGRGYRFVPPVTQGAPHEVLPAGASSGNGTRAEPCEPESAAASSQAPSPPRAISGRRRPPRRVTLLIGVLCLLAVAITISRWHSLWPAHTPSARRLSIVVMPFANLGNDPDQQYFADGVVEDLTTDLSSRVSDLSVISAETAFTYRNKPIDAKQIGRELGVGYVLEGSVQRAGSQIRVNAQLIDAETDTQLWAERFDRQMSNLLALQSEITSRIANALGAELLAREGARETENPDAVDFILRGRAATLRPTSRDSYTAIISQFERALALDPESVEARSRLASALANRALIGVTDSAAVDTARATGLAERALAAAPRSTLAHIAKANVLRAQGRCDQAIPEFETVLAIDRNAVDVLDALADCKLLTGAIDEVIPLEERAIRLSPRDPAIGWWYARIGQVHLYQSRPGEAIRWLEKARSAVPELPFVYAFLASAYGLKGETERASAELAQARRFTGDGHVSSIAALKAFGAAHGYYRARNIDFESTYFAGLRKAGMPEE